VDPPPLLAVGLLLAGRQVLVVGAGPVGQSKIARLLEIHAVLRVVAPIATEQVQAWAHAGQLVWHAREFQPTDLDGCFFVVTATGPAHDPVVFAACEAGQILCNAADVPQACSVYLLSQTQRGPVTLATGTSGLAPGLAGRLRREAEAGLPADIEVLVARYASVRRWLLDRTEADPQGRRGLALRWLATQPWDLLRQPEPEVREVVEQRIRNHS
jgi:siroheme synthase-like protein